MVRMRGSDVGWFFLHEEAFLRWADIGLPGTMTADRRYPTSEVWKSVSHRYMDNADRHQLALSQVETSPLADQSTQSET